MIRKIIIAAIVFSFLIPHVAPQQALAGGAGGEPLMSDEVGWGIVAAMVIVGIYLVYKIPPEAPPCNEQEQKKTETGSIFQKDASEIITPHGDVVIARW